MDHFVLQFFILFDHVSASENTFLVHIDEALPNIILGILQRSQIESQRRDFPPVISLKHMQLLLNVVVVLQSAIVFKYVTHDSQVFLKLSLQGFMPETRNVLVFL